MTHYNSLKLEKRINAKQKQQLKTPQWLCGFNSFHLWGFYLIFDKTIGLIIKPLKSPKNALTLAPL